MRLTPRARLNVLWAALPALVAGCPAADHSPTTAAALPAPSASAPDAPDAPPVIFDTDMWSDIDDALALAMLHSLHEQHEINLVAVTVSTAEPWSASYVDLVNTFYGHADIPIGLTHDGPTPEDFAKRFPQSKGPTTRYTEILSQRTESDGSLRYPHQLVDGAKAPEAVSLLRKTLAAQPDGSVVMIQVGYSTNFARLLDSPADASSPLSGRELVAQKVRLLSAMAGNFHETRSGTRTFPEGSPEFNLMVDVRAAQKVFSSWPTPIVDSGFEIGLGMLYPGQSITGDYAYVEHHPIAETYLTFCEEQKERGGMKQCPHNHPTFDLTAVLYAARPDGGYFSLSQPGRIKVLAGGGSRFEESADGSHRHLILDEQQKARTLDAMVTLASRPPRKTF